MKHFCILLNHWLARRRSRRYDLRSRLGNAVARVQIDGVYLDMGEFREAVPDLTVNALEYDVLTGSIVDVSQKGLTDLSNGIIRTIRPAMELFVQDPLRLFRAVDTAAKLHFRLDDDIINAAKTDMVRISLLKAYKPALFSEVHTAARKTNFLRYMMVLSSMNLFTILFPFPKDSLLTIVQPLSEQPLFRGPCNDRKDGLKRSAAPKVDKFIPIELDVDTEISAAVVANLGVLYWLQDFVWDARSSSETFPSAAFLNIAKLVSKINAGNFAEDKAVGYANIKNVFWDTLLNVCWGYCRLGVVFYPFYGLFGKGQKSNRAEEILSATDIINEVCFFLKIGGEVSYRRHPESSWPEKTRSDKENK
jgi:hypothetical protein